jgi:cobyric acid synthase
LPGSKNVVADLSYLEASDLGSAIVRCADHGTAVVGICGGFQMLGRVVLDSHGLEGAPGGRVAGLGLLEMDTGLAAEKRLIQRQGIHVPSGQPVHGYEIHHGRSSETGNVLEFSDGTTCGAVDRSGKVWGCYLHGIFDSDAYRRWFINGLRREKGLSDFRGQTSCYDLEPALDRLAAVLRQHLDMDRIYALLEL